MQPRPSSLLLGLFRVLGGLALILRLRVPGSRDLPWLTAALLALLALRVAGLVRDWRLARVSGTRILLPAVVLVEGMGLVLTGASHLALQLRLATALALELLLLVLAARAWSTARSLAGAWPEDRIASAFEAFVPPRAARLMALELVLLGSALHFLSGGFRDPAPAGFSHHRESALRAFLPALPLLIPGDVLFLHALFPRMTPWLRWALHGSTLYAVLWMFGYYAALKARPHQIRDGLVHLRLGLLKAVSFPVDQVRSAISLPNFDDDWTRRAHLKGVQQLVAKGCPVLELALAEPARVTGLLGPGQPADRLTVSVDDPSAFLAALGRPCA